MKKESRQLHRNLAPVLLLPILLTTLTGMGYRLGHSWFGLSESLGDWMLALHEGRYLGKPLVPLYVLLVGLGLLGLLGTGLAMAIAHPRRIASPKNHRWFHRLLAVMAALPILVTVLTGMGYRLGRAWFGLGEDQIDVLMRIHQGSWLGHTLRPFYVLAVGVSLLALLITGFQMMGLFRRRKPTLSEKG